MHETEGMYELSTANIPFITTLTKFMQSFVSEHKVGIYYFWRTEFVNQKWGTPAPIKYADPIYKFPVGLRAFGNFSFKISDANVEMPAMKTILPLISVLFLSHCHALSPFRTASLRPLN